MDYLRNLGRWLLIAYRTVNKKMEIEHSILELTIYSIYVTFFSSWPLFLKFDRDRFLWATFLQVLSFPAGCLPYFGTSVRQTVNRDCGLQSRIHSSSNRITSLILNIILKIVFYKEAFLA